MDRTTLHTQRRGSAAPGSATTKPNPPVVSDARKLRLIRMPAEDGARADPSPLSPVTMHTGPQISRRRPAAAPETPGQVERRLQLSIAQRNFDDAIRWFTGKAQVLAHGAHAPGAAKELVQAAIDAAYWFEDYRSTSPAGLDDTHPMARDLSNLMFILRDALLRPAVAGHVAPSHLLDLFVALGATGRVAEATHLCRHVWGRLVSDEAGDFVAEVVRSGAGASHAAGEAWRTVETLVRDEADQRGTTRFLRECRRFLDQQAARDQPVVAPGDRVRKAIDEEVRLLAGIGAAQAVRDTAAATDARHRLAAVRGEREASLKAFAALVPTEDERLAFARACREAVVRLEGARNRLKKAVREAGEREVAGAACELAETHLNYRTTLALAARVGLPTDAYASTAFNPAGVEEIIGAIPRNELAEELLQDLDSAIHKVAIANSL
jgi:hypothetical protein